ncbi:hypothetical protein F5883DRAFT_608593 [Diaporthe sp. PMI_573]|nr:hypothetical protein F5883DRAFT_608593 [Diaporthaceae sp. PMI_573]
MSFNLTGVPQCGVSCLVSSLSASSCALTDYTCLCLDNVYNNAVTNCVILGCAVKEQLAVKRITATNCNLPAIDRGPIVTLLQIVVTIIQDVFFFFRITSRILKLAPWGPDDTTIVIAFISNKQYTANQNGLGMDIWFVPFNQITNFLQISFVFEVLYTITIGIIKISITFLYLRLFPDRRIRRFLWATQIFNVTLVGVFVIVDLAQCQPMSYFWDMWDGEHVGRCINIYAMAWAHAIINIVLDVWMLALPASQVWGLKMPFRRKFGVMVMFGLGIL